MARGAARYEVVVAKRLAIVEQADPARERGERADAAENRRRVLAAARRLMRERPMAEIAMDDVARVAGVGKGTLYRRFADRAALFMALLDDGERALQDDVVRGFDLPRGAADAARLEALLDALFSFALDHAPILAEAEACARRGARMDAGPMQWRRDELTRRIVAATATETSSAAIVADMVLASLSAEVLLRQLAAGATAADLRRAWRETWRRALL